MFAEYVTDICWVGVIFITIFEWLLFAFAGIIIEARYEAVGFGPVFSKVHFVQKVFKSSPLSTFDSFLQFSLGLPHLDTVVDLFSPFSILPRCVAILFQGS